MFERIARSSLRSIYLCTGIIPRRRRSRCSSCLALIPKVLLVEVLPCAVKCEGRFTCQSVGTNRSNGEARPPESRGPQGVRGDVATSGQQDRRYCWSAGRTRAGTGRCRPRYDDERPHAAWVVVFVTRTGFDPAPTTWSCPKVNQVAQAPRTFDEGQGTTRRIFRSSRCFACRRTSKVFHQGHPVPESSHAPTNQNPAKSISNGQLAHHACRRMFLRERYGVELSCR